jgi:RNA-directed DNA polymerase
LSSDFAATLGIPAIEDKLVQLAVVRILEAIYEQDFLRCSFGYRPGVGALDAVDKLTVKLQFGRYHFVVEADIKAFFDNISHEQLVEMLKERIADGALLRLINKWLKAGVLDTTGEVIKPSGGSPQGGIVSPLLAAEASDSEEPGARKPHAGICAGAGG